MIGQSPRYPVPDWPLAGMESGNNPGLSLVSCTALLVEARHQVCPDTVTRSPQVTSDGTDKARQVRSQINIDISDQRSNIGMVGVGQDPKIK